MKSRQSSKVPSLEVEESTSYTAANDAEKESNRLLEEYLGPEIAMKDINKLTKACAACDGEQGVSHSNLYPDIGGQNASVLIERVTCIPKWFSH